MEILVFQSKVEASDYAVKLFADTLQEGTEVFGLATGSTPEVLYEKLIASDLDFSQAVSINLDEYYSLSSDNPQSYAHFMQEHLFNEKPFRESYLPNGLNDNVEEELTRYDSIIEDNPIDLQLLGIGTNAHIGFNEPGSDFDAETQLVDLAPETIKANQRFFASADDVPKQAYSMGIASIMKAKQIVLMAFGENKADAIQKTVLGPVTEDVPSSILQEHAHVTLLLDNEAASLLDEANYTDMA